LYFGDGYGTSDDNILSKSLS